jgi:antibiotic biosynthesis monooxygenase (ABM) superfamily enzyme
MYGAASEVKEIIRAGEQGWKKLNMSPVIQAISTTSLSVWYKVYMTVMIANTFIMHKQAWALLVLLECIASAHSLIAKQQKL